MIMARGGVGLRWFVEYICYGYFRDIRVRYPGDELSTNFESFRKEEDGVDRKVKTARYKKERTVVDNPPKGIIF